MTDLNKLSSAALKAALTGGTAHWGKWASASDHTRYADKVLPQSRRRCNCGCKGRATHNGLCNGIALMDGCELRVARWVKTGAIK